MSAPQAEPKYMTVEQVASLLQVSTKSVTRWSRADSTMPAIKLGRVVRFERTALERWLARKRPRASRTAQAQAGQP